MQPEAKELRHPSGAGRGSSILPEGRLLTSGLCPSNIDSILLASRVQENYLLVFVVTTFVIIYYTAAQEANAQGLCCLKFIIVDLVQC